MSMSLLNSSEKTKQYSLTSLEGCEVGIAVGYKDKQR